MRARASPRRSESRPPIRARLVASARALHVAFDEGWIDPIEIGGRQVAVQRPRKVEELIISVKTVERHRQNILDKLGMRTVSRSRGTRFDAP